MTLMKQLTIQTVAPFLANQFIDSATHTFDFTAYESFLAQHAEQLGSFKKYLIDKLHDSKVLEIAHNHEQLRIVLDDFNTLVFAEALLSKKQPALHPESFTFPITLEFQGNPSIHYYQVTPEGVLHPIPPVPVDEYLYEQVTQITNQCIEIAFKFWKSGSPGKAILVMVSSQQLTVTEGQDEAWQQVFGDQFDAYYSYFKEQFNEGRYLSDYQECLNLIKELDLLKK